MAIRKFIERKAYLSRWWSFKIGDTVGLPVFAGFAAAVISDEEYSGFYPGVVARTRDVGWVQPGHLFPGKKPDDWVLHLGRCVPAKRALPHYHLRCDVLPNGECTASGCRGSRTDKGNRPGFCRAGDLRRCLVG